MAVVTVARYRLLTGDTTTDATTVSARIDDATEMVEEELDRPLELKERTETLRLDGDTHGWATWRAYPRSTPIVSIPADVGYRIEDDVTLANASPDTGYWWSWTTCQEAPRSTLTWTGGFTSDTLPKKLESAICDLAAALTRASSGAAFVPVGASSVRVGDVTISYGSTSVTGGAGSGLEMYVPGLWDRIRRYRHRRPLTP